MSTATHTPLTLAYCDALRARKAALRNAMVKLPGSNHRLRVATLALMRAEAAFLACHPEMGELVGDASDTILRRLDFVAA